MVSRRKILSRSRDDLSYDQSRLQQLEEEDVWFQKDKLFKEHIQEVLEKWKQIDDEIWAKVIVFERNRRVAKAYARAPVLTVNGSEDGFDGIRIGLCGFDNHLRDQKIQEAKSQIGQGVKIKMDGAGNILVRRFSKSNVYIKSTAISSNEETSLGSEVINLKNQSLEYDKVVKIFDMKKFQMNVKRELDGAYPDRRRLETQCLSVLAFVKSENDILDCPIWILIVNVVAMDMLKSKLPQVHRPIDIKNRPRIPVPDEESPYSITDASSSNSSGFIPTRSNIVDKQSMKIASQLESTRGGMPPKLPPRGIFYPSTINDVGNEDLSVFFGDRISDKGKEKKINDDPYYCGMRAKFCVPNFVMNDKKIKDRKNLPIRGNNIVKDKTPEINNWNHQQISALRHSNYKIWKANRFPNNDVEESPYQIYGRLPFPKSYVSTNRRDWD